MDERKMWQSKFMKMSSFLCASFVLAACQTSPQPTTSISSSKGHQERPLKLTQSTDGLQDIAWQIQQINGQNARFYGQTPSLKLNSQFKRIEGHTGCNQIQGRYELNHSQKSLTLDAKAGHYSCDKALAQEAELADALQNVRRFQLNQRQLILLDARGRTLISAQRP
jgi:heat shock protein HslJ